MDHIPYGRATRVVLLLAAVSAVSFVATAQSRQLRLVSTAWPPFTNEAGESPSPQSPPPPHRYYFGGNIYSDWASVPRAYKSGNSSPPDPGRSTASIFTFSWR